MSGVSVSHLVLFIASLVVAAGVAGTLVTEVDRVSNSVAESSDGVSEQIETDFEIISDSGSEALYEPGGDGDGGQLTLLVKNTGSVNLAADSGYLDVLVDGRYVPPADVSVQRADNGGEGSWTTGSVVEVTIDLQEDLDGDTRASIRVNGNEAVLQFYVEGGQG